jgi:hypothetical protein
LKIELEAGLQVEEEVIFNEHKKLTMVFLFDKKNIALHGCQNSVTNYL